MLSCISEPANLPIGSPTIQRTLHRQLASKREQVDDLVPVDTILKKRLAHSCRGRWSRVWGWVAQSFSQWSPRPRASLPSDDAHWVATNWPHAQSLLIWLMHFGAGFPFIFRLLQSPVDVIKRQLMRVLCLQSSLCVWLSTLVGSSGCWCCCIFDLQLSEWSIIEHKIARTLEFIAQSAEASMANELPCCTDADLMRVVVCTIKHVIFWVTVQ